MRKSKLRKQERRKNHLKNVKIQQSKKAERKALRLREKANEKEPSN